MKRDLTCVLVFKVAVLGALWYLFFSGAHQPSVDASAVGAHLAVRAWTPSSAQPTAPQGRELTQHD